MLLTLLRTGQEFIQGMDLGSKVVVVEKGVFLITHVHKCGVQTGNQFFDFSDIQVAYIETLFVIGVAVQLHQFSFAKNGNICLIAHP